MKKETQEEIADIVRLAAARTGQSISEVKIQKAKKDKDVGRLIFWNILKGIGEAAEDSINERRQKRKCGY